MNQDRGETSPLPPAGVPVVRSIVTAPLPPVVEPAAPGRSTPSVRTSPDDFHQSGREYGPPPRRRRVWLPLLLFLATAMSTFWAGSTAREPEGPFEILLLLDQPAEIVVRLLYGWREGMQYMLAVMSILLAHEMGHFLQAVRYRVPATLPFFIPMPFTPLGTMGAVIAMRGSQADRRQIFDIGISGPIAGLVIALPVAWAGIATATPGGDPMYFNDPLILRLMVDYLHPELAPGQALGWNPLYMAGWVGMLITGLNMMPISQLDGGHVTYALMGRGAHWLARALVLAAVAFILAYDEYGWALMLALVVFLGTDHPRTANDRAPLGWWRYALGWASLAIPILCFVPVPVNRHFF